MSAAACLPALSQETPARARPSLCTPQGGQSFHAQIDAEIPRLRRHARKLCRNVHDADDLVNDTVERALRYQHRFEPGTNAGAWLNTVLYSVFVTGFRRRAVERRALGRFAKEAAASVGSVPSPPIGLLRGFEGMLRQLAPPFFEVMLLVDLHELTYREVAEQLSLPIGTVMSRVHRARRFLRVGLQESGAGYSVH